MRTILADRPARTIGRCSDLLRQAIILLSTSPSAIRTTTMYGFSLSNVHIFCFAASYTVALLLEISRLFLRAPVRIIGTVGFTVAGLLAQTAYIVMRSSPHPQQPPPLSSWYDWLLLIAWGVAGAYLLIKLRRPQAATGIFMLPVVLGLIGIAYVFQDVPPFPRSQALYVWVIIHGVGLLVGSVVVMLGFVAGLMYLVQSHRLKRKLPPRQGLRLPSLEWLQNANRRALLLSSWLLVVGLVAGLPMNIVKGHEGMTWTDPVVWTSGMLFIWLITVLTFESLYKPARQGRKVAYLTLASFVFLGLVLGIVLLGPSQHASPQDDDAAAVEDSVPRPVAGPQPNSSCRSVYTGPLVSIRRGRERHGASHRYFPGNRRLAPYRSLFVHPFGEYLRPLPLVAEIRASKHDARRLQCGGVL